MATSDPKALCGAKASTTGKPCTRTAGWGTGHAGTGRCKFHGGASPQAELSGAVHLARREATVMGAPLDVEPHVAILECIRIAAGEVRYASEQIAALDPDHAAGPIVTTVERIGGENGGSSETRHGPSALHIWVVARHQAMDRLVDYSKVAINAGIEERRVKLAEQQGALLAQAIRGILAELGVGDRPDVPGIVRRHLTLVAAA
jgi:hypothetical protein